MVDYPTISNTKAENGASVTLVGDGKIDRVEANDSEILLTKEKIVPFWKNPSVVGCILTVIGIFVSLTLWKLT